MNQTRWARPVVVRLVVAALVAVLAPVAPDSAVAGAAAPAAGATFVDSGRRDAPNLTAAAELAALVGEPVLAQDLTDERSQHWANPDGTVTLEQYLLPQRVRRAGGWLPVDTTLKRVGDRVVPEATALDLSLSGGGDGDLLVLSTAGARLALAWPERLPAPELAGDTATYRQVYSGVDLLVRAEPESFQLLLVVANRRAAVNPALSRVAWQVATEGLSLRATGGGAVEAVDGSGKVVFESPGSYMWDSPRRDLAAAALAEPAPGTVVPIPVEVSRTELAVRPDRELLTSPDTTFPVTIDPPFTKPTPNKWAPVFREQPDRAWPSGTGQPREEYKVGLLDWPGCGDWCGLWRSVFSFDIGQMKRQQLVGNPSFHIELAHSGSCSPTPVELWQTQRIMTTSPVTWNYLRGRWLHRLQEKSASANKSSCGQPNVRMEFSSTALRNRLQAEMSDANDYFTLGLKATNEPDRNQWKRFKLGTAKLEATYNLPPNAPTGLMVGGDCYHACGSPAVLRTRTPELRARVSDPNGGSLRQVQFQLQEAATGQEVTTGQVTGPASGQVASWRPPSLPEARELRFRVRAQDGHLAWGAWSGYFRMLIDTTPPHPPTVSAGLYRHFDTGTWNGGPGVPDDFTFTAAGSADVIEYQWRFADGNVAHREVAPGAPHTARITPPGDLLQELAVRSIDHAGNPSDWVPYPFLVRPQPAASGYWKLNEGAGTSTEPAVGGSRYGGHLHGDAGWVADGLPSCGRATTGECDQPEPRRAVSLGGTGWVEMPSPVDTFHAAGFSVSAWVYPTDLSGDQTVVAQDGVNQAMFRLHYRPEANGGAGGWCFSVRAADDPAAEETRACSTTPPRLHEWTYLVGVYDRPHAGNPRSLRLHVNGGRDSGHGSTAEAEAWAPWRAAGSFVVGRARTGPDNRPGAYWRGYIDEVRLYQRVLDPQADQGEIAYVYQACTQAVCPMPWQLPLETVYSGQFSRWVDAAGDRLTDASGTGRFGYRFEAPLGLPAPDGAPGTQLLYGCVAGQLADDAFTSGDPDCEGQARLGEIGRVYLTPPAGVPSVPLYRCRVTTPGLPTTGHHFDSTDPDCEGPTAQQEHHFGYLRAYAHVIRYAGGGDHRTATGAVPDPYDPEGAFGLVSIVEGVGMRALYGCRDAAGSYSSLDPGCEGGQRLELVGYLWSNPPSGGDSYPLYRCVTAGGDRFDSLDEQCEGRQRDLPEPFGYVLREW